MLPMAGGVQAGRAGCSHDPQKAQKDGSEINKAELTWLYWGTLSGLTKSKQRHLTRTQLVAFLAVHPRPQEKLPEDLCLAES